MTTNQTDVSRAIKVLMEASPEFRAAAEQAVQAIAKFATAVQDNPKWQAVLQAEQTRIADGDDEPPALEAS